MHMCKRLREGIPKCRALIQWGTRDRIYNKNIQVYALVRPLPAGHLILRVLESKPRMLFVSWQRSIACRMVASNQCDLGTTRNTY